MARKLLVATNNRGKLGELNGLLAGLPIDLLSLSDIGCTVEIEETGSTFAENAALKAIGYASLSGLMTIADDSGLEIEALDNRPGVLSARYGGAELGFYKKMSMLLGELDKTGDTRRKARFVSSIAIADAAGEIVHSAEGICSGTIAPFPRGTNGFGYDPLFIPDGFDQTFGELSDTVKQKISHRAHAFCQIIPFLRLFYAV
ncbi:MAG: RdgB/HAM1 family non-canonical purine NTP pyrophosphatase [Chloracidobacterium sp.]|nr:RdgB/HAM1 family non-canonical purine NTP pyrophosphatase [Chloracidobacterium sp.]